MTREALTEFVFLFSHTEMCGSFWIDKFSWGRDSRGITVEIRQAIITARGSNERWMPPDWKTIMAIIDTKVTREKAENSSPFSRKLIMACLLGPRTVIIIIMLNYVVAYLSDRKILHLFRPCNQCYCCCRFLMPSRIIAPIIFLPLTYTYWRRSR